MIAARKRFLFPTPPTDLAGYNPTRDAGDCVWNREAAERAVNFFPDVLQLTQGKTAGQRFAPQQWQADYLATLFGWQRPDGTRRYRESLFAVPRKNGKTETGAGIAHYTLSADGEQAAEIYSAACNREQASRVYEPAARMVQASPLLSGLCKVVDSKKRIVFYKTASYYCALSADASTSHGKNPHCVLFDELHTQPNDKLYEGLKTGMGFRRQPLFVSMTTAGTDRHSLCWDVWSHARRVRDGLSKDPSFLPMLYEIKEDEDWRDENVWRRVNPNLDVTVTIQFLRDEFERACSSPRYENSFRNLYLNEWTQQAVRWLPMDAWEECGAELPDLSGREAWCGLDLSSTVDVSALVLAIPGPDGKTWLVPHFWLPADTCEQRSKRDRVPYAEWATQGFVTLTNGSAVDYDQIRKDLHAIADRYWIKELRIDPWNATQLATQLQADGLPVVFMRQGYASMSGPAKEFEKALVRREVRHPHNPCLTWMAGNVAVERDPSDNIKPSKSKSTERIDGIAAAVMAIAGVVQAQSQSWYYDSNSVEMG